jgi:hypothetical protein
MTFVIGDRVHEQSTTTGTGTYDLDGAESGMQDFVSGVGDGNQTYYVASEGTSWEVGIGTVTSAVPNTLSRDRIIDSSNSGSAVNWGAGTRDILGTVAGEAFKEKVTTKSASFSVTDLTDRVIYECSSASANITATLPSVATVEPGFEVTFICLNSSDYSTTVVPYGYITGDDFEGNSANSYSCDAGMSVTVRLASSGDNWIVASTGRSVAGNASLSSSRALMYSYNDANGHAIVRSSDYNLGSGAADRSSSPDYFTSTTQSAGAYTADFECWISATNTISYKNIVGVTVSYTYMKNNEDVVSGTIVNNGTITISVASGDIIQMHVVTLNGLFVARLFFTASSSGTNMNCQWLS